MTALWEQLPARTVLDGEIVRWSPEGALDFAALQHRVGGGHARHLALTSPCHYVIFDILEVEGTDLRSQPLIQRRRRLERLFAGIPAAGPLALSMQTADLAEARLWMQVLADKGIEGLVIKAAADPYRAGVRGWWKYKVRTTAKMILGGVTGRLDRPHGLILGRYARGEANVDGVLRIVGRTTRLHAAQAVEVAAHLNPAAADHPWPALLAPGWAGGWYGKGEALSYVRVRPEVVVEVLADVAQEHGRWRHPLRYLRLRLDVPPEAVPRGTSVRTG